MVMVKIVCRGYTSDDKERRVVVSADMPSDRWALIAHVIMRFFVSKSSPLIDLDFDMLHCEAKCEGKQCRSKNAWKMQAKHAEKLLKNKPTWL
ncbi:MAG: hypothetical protein GSR84_08965 [Desulfurococcales archaeon]|nr:hypothetical protein [Desulfurococcales archaeon]